MLSALRFQRLSTCLLAVLLVTAAIPAALPASASATSAAETASAASDSEARFTETIYHEQRGDVFEIGVSLSGTDAATVSFGPDANASATVVVRDADGDGRATVLLNSYDSTFRASDGDSLVVRERSNGSLMDDDRDVVVHPGNGTDRDPTDVATLVVTERSTHDLRTWVAPRSADLSNLSAVNAAKASENLTRTDVVIRNATLVLELRASGLEGALAAGDGSNVTEQFFDLLEGDAAELRVRQTNPGPEVRAAEIRLAEDSAHVVADPVNDSYYVVVDLEDANVTRGERKAEIRRGQEYEANFSLAGSSTLASNGTESAAANFAIVRPAAELSTVGERRELVEPAPNQTLSGRASIPSGSAVTVELVAKEGDRRFSETVRVRNGSDGGGEFAASFDFSDVPAGTNFAADVRAESYPELAFRTTRIVVSEPTARTEISTVTSTGVSLDATLSHGGFVAVRYGSSDGDLLGYSQYLKAGTDANSYVSLDPDLESNATLVAVAYRDTDRDGEFDPEADEPYASEGSVVADAIEFTVEKTTATTTETTADSTIRETTEAPMPDETTDPGNDGEIPGFGVTSALVALLAVGLFARGR